ncbi:phosphatidyl inositol kinase, partial [Mortierella sp. GBA30]
MPNRSGYVPLGQDDGLDDSHNPQQQQQQQHPAQTEQAAQPRAQQQEQAQQAGSVHEHLPHALRHAQEYNQNHGHDTISQDQSADKTAAKIQTSSFSFDRPVAQSRVLAPAAVPNSSTTAATSSCFASGSASATSSSFQFPKFEKKHKSLLGLKDRSDHSSGSPYERLINSKSLGTGLLSNDRRNSLHRYDSSISVFAHIRPKQHPHTTLDGPRGIRKSQRQQVLREIRPDPHNLPEELLREQARSGAAMDAIMTGNNSSTMHHENNADASGGARERDYMSISAPGSPVAGGNGGERGTLLGSGDGLGLGIGLGGKANTPPVSRWSNRTKLGRRLRRVPGSGLGRENDQRVIQSSVFKPISMSVEDGQPVTPAPALTPDHAEPMTSERFVAIVDSVKDAIHSGIQPLRIAQGSSGSYFCRNIDGKIVGVFKPKNEEPYGQLNPKWAKWIHRNLFPCCFGRSCLIPNLGYISESATSLVDRRLKLNIVPSTEVIWLSSPAFHYDYLDRRAAKLQKGAKPLPDKVGSFQLFLNGFKDANLFMRDHPWPVESLAPASIASSGDTNAYGKGRSSWRLSGPESVHSTCQDTDGSSVYGSITGSTHGGLAGGTRIERAGFSWTPTLQQQFREQFEKMIILDYLIRNTDRGLDNWMIRYCEKEGISIVAGPNAGAQKGNLGFQQSYQKHAKRNSRLDDLLGLDRGQAGSSSSSLREGARQNTLVTPPGTPPRSSISKAQPSSRDGQDGAVQQGQGCSASPTTQETTGTDDGSKAANAAEGNSGAPHTMESYYGLNHVHVAAIDNGLAFPFKHPDSWRSYPYGWLFLPRPLISQPFTKATRDHFLPLLSSPVWWRETIADLRRLFSIDSDFDQGMFDKQMAVMKGQGWNIVETLKNLDHGPIDLCRRVAVVVWDEEVTLEAGVSLSPPAVGNGENDQGRAQGQSLGRDQMYTTIQPKAMTMDAIKASYSNYGSMMTLGDRVSTSKTLSASSTAIGESTPFLSSSKDVQSQFKKGSLPHVAIDLDNDENDGNDRGMRFKHDSFRQVVSDGEYDMDDDDYGDEDAFSFEGDYDEYEDDADSNEGGQGARIRNASGTSQLSLSPGPRDGMISIDMALTDASAAAATTSSGAIRRQQRRHSVGRPQRSYSNSVVTGSPDATVAAVSMAASSTLVTLPSDTAQNMNMNHRRSRTEQDYRSGGGIRFDTSVGKNPFASAEDSRADTVDEPERGRSRGIFAQGYGAISVKDLNSVSGSPDDNRLSERPKWADRLRRGLSFDGHLLAVGGIARRERKLRKQRQRERELREQRVVLVERIEAVTKNLPYFKW